MMTKVKVFLVGILTLVLSLFCLVGCGVEGSYKFESMTVGSLLGAKTYEVGQEYDGKELTKDYFVLEFKEDGTAIVKGEGADLLGGEGATYTWTEEEGTYTFNQGIIPVFTATIDGSEMTIKVGVDGVAGMTFVLKKGLF